MVKSFWIGSVATMLLGAPWAEGQDGRNRSEHPTGTVRIVLQAAAEPDKKGQAQVKVSGEPVQVQVQRRGTKDVNKTVNQQRDMTIKLGEYWIGVSCRPAGDALRAQLRLPEGQGLVVDHVVKDGPAAKGGVKEHDVLLKAGKTPLKELPDLIGAVEEAKDSELALELIRGGKKKTVKFAPAKRPEKAVAERPWNVLPEGIDPRQFQNWIPKIEQGELKGPIEFRIVRPGALLPPVANVHPRLPGNLSIAITRQGDEPTKIVVTKGDQKWEVTEKELGELPDDVRPHVERMLGRINLTAPLEKIRAFNLVPKVVRPDGEKLKIEQRFLPHGVVPDVLHQQHRKQIDKQIEEMNRQIEELRKSVDQLRRNVAGAEPEKGEAKND